MLKVFLFVFLSVQIYAQTVFTANGKSNAVSAAQSLTSTTSSYYNKSNLQNHVFNPMSSDTNITTVNGLKTGKANLTCTQGASYPFLKVSYTGTSDINIEVDTDVALSGNFTKTQYFNGISGITPSGVIKCDANTFNNCHYYNWSYNSGTLSLVNSQVTDNGYCINSSCGDIAASDPQKILTDLIGTLSAIYQQAYKNIVISQSNITNSYAIANGQKYSNCGTSGPYTAGSATPSDATLNSQAAAAQQSDTSGAWSTIKSASNNSNNVNPISNSDLSGVEQVAKTTSSATVSNGNTVNYTSIYKNSAGQWVTSPDSAQISFQPGSKPIGCLVQYKVTQNQVLSNGKVKGQSGAGSGDSTTIKTKILQCVNNVCPVQKGETIKYNCGYLQKSETDAIGAMSAINSMAKDMSCSTN